ncbi:MAG: thermonuclease family protein [Alphaproteobacteria bacterium]|nr:thermonuclease family protein [Alphaproteobacteria bacterium]
MSITDGDTLRVTFKEGADSEPVRLLGINTPELAHEDDETGYVRPAEPLAEEAKKALEAITYGHIITLKYPYPSSSVTPDGVNRGSRTNISRSDSSPNEKRDRHGRHLAMLYDEKGTWVQEAMLRQGWGVVYLFPDSTFDPAPLFKAESEARAAKRGLWADSYYAVIDQKDAGDFIGRYKLVEGTPYQVVTVKGTTYVNFAEDWKTDFTLRIPPEHKNLFAKADLKALEGRKIRARGWLRLKNGPMIDLTHPGQIEALP